MGIITMSVRDWTHCAKKPIAVAWILWCLGIRTDHWSNTIRNLPLSIREVCPIRDSREENRLILWWNSTVREKRILRSTIYKGAKISTKVQKIQKHEKIFKIFKISKKMLTSMNVYYIICLASRVMQKWILWITGCGSAWLERLVWDQEAAGSNPVTPTLRV